MSRILTEAEWNVTFGITNGAQVAKIVAPLEQPLGLQPLTKDWEEKFRKALRDIDLEFNPGIVVMSLEQCERKFGHRGDLHRIELAELFEFLGFPPGGYVSMLDHIDSVFGLNDELWDAKNRDLPFFLPKRKGESTNDELWYILWEMTHDNVLSSFQGDLWQLPRGSFCIIPLYSFYGLIRSLWLQIGLVIRGRKAVAAKVAPFVEFFLKGNYPLLYRARWDIKTIKEEVKESSVIIVTR